MSTHIYGVTKQFNRSKVIGGKITLVVGRKKNKKGKKGKATTVTYRVGASTGRKNEYILIPI